MKTCIKTAWSILAFLFCFFQAHAQHTVSGLITDESQEAVLGASVQVKGTTLGTISDENGNDGSFLFTTFCIERSETLNYTSPFYVESISSYALARATPLAIKDLVNPSMAYIALMP